MADQGLIGHYHDAPTVSTYVNALKHYTRKFPSDYRVGYVAFQRECPTADSAVLRLNKHYTRKFPSDYRGSYVAFQRECPTANSAVLRLNKHYVRDVETWINTGVALRIGSYSSDFICRLVFPAARSGLVNNQRQDGTIQGYVKDGGVAQASVSVGLFYRDPLQLAAVTRTDAAGYYRFDRLAADRTDYFAVMMDPPGGNVNNAQRLDYLQPMLTFSTIPKTVFAAQASFVLPEVMYGGNDPSFANVSLLMHMNNATTDVKGKTPSVVGALPFSSTSKKFGSHAITFPGGTNYFTVPVSADFAFGAGDWTIEFWINAAQAQVGGAAFIDFRSTNTQSAPVVYFISTNVPTPTLYVNGANVFTASTGFTVNQWQHFAVCKASGQLRMFIDGALVGSAADANTYVAPGAVYFGSNQQSTSASFVGLIDELRITKGVGRYPAAFVPTPFPFLDS